MVSAGVQRLVERYHKRGYSYRLIHYLLETRHNFTISYSYLCRKVIPSLALARRRGHIYDNFDEIVQVSKNEISNGVSGSEYLRKLLALKHGLEITRQFSRELVRIFDAEGVKRRRRRRLRRRQYINKGPNYVWHLGKKSVCIFKPPAKQNGYDKLAPYGIFIHGCIDGFSRKVLWLEAGISNKKPDIVATYYLNSVEKEGGYPCKLRADFGTENVMVAEIHRMLTGNEKNFIYGKSTSNQRIERWWGQLRQYRADFWIDHVKTLESSGLFAKDNPLHRLCLQFSYIPVIQKQLKEVVTIWNNHTIRKQRMGDIVSGIPNILHSNPEIVDTCSFLNTDTDDIVHFKNICKNDNLHLDQDFVTAATDILQSVGLPLTETLLELEDSKNMFIVLKDFLND